ncbi:hypothetical protein AABM38_10025 [Heyndrickxia sp. MSNUG]
MFKFSEKALQDFYHAILPGLIRIAKEEKAKKKTAAKKNRSDGRDD